MKFKIKKISLVSFFVCVLVIITTGCRKKNNTPVPAPLEWGTVTDVDGNTYKTVKIGNQWWMAENLKTTHYRNGWPIKQEQNDSLWGLETKGAYCAYLNDYVQTLSTYGGLYNWYTIVDTSNIAPVGWHVPSDNEWMQLEAVMGMYYGDLQKVNWRGNVEACHLKIHSPESWEPYGNLWSDNSSGFTALPGSCRIFDGRWSDTGIPYSGFWWSSTTHPGNKAWFRSLDYQKVNVFRYYTYKTYGMSIRCVKD